MEALNAQTPIPCARCGRELVNPVSIARGLGPICAGREISEDFTLSAEERVAKLEALIAEAVGAGEAASSILELRRQLTQAKQLQEHVARATGQGPAPTARQTGSAFVQRVFTELFAVKLPGYEPRPSQVQMAECVAECLAADKHAIIEAPCGVGKSMAYLVPAIEYARRGHRVVISTGTIALQEQLMLKDIPFLQGVIEEPFKAVLVKGKSNYVCKLRLDKEIGTQSLFAEQNAADPELAPILTWLGETQTGDKSELATIPGPIWGRICGDDECPKRKCAHFADCYIMRARAQAEQADLIVCNHHLFFADLKVQRATGGFASILPEHAAVIFDEAHHVADIAVEAFGDECSEWRVPALIRDAQKVAPALDRKLGEALEAANRAFFESLLDPDEKSDRYKLRHQVDAAELQERLLALADALSDAVYRSSEDEERGAKLAERARGIADSLDAMLKPGCDNHVTWVEVQRRGERRTVTLHGTPVDVSAQLRDELFEATRSVILTSATLATGGNFTWQRRLLGLHQYDGNDCRELIVDSPFNYREQCLWYFPSDLPDPREPHFTTAITDEIERILLATQGRAFVLFTSYQQLNQVHGNLEPILPFPCLKQGDAPRSQLVERFKSLGNAVLFATSSFWEGIDVQGEALSCVILAKLPFSVPTEPVTQAKVDAIERRGGNAFMEHSVPEACLKLKQGAGRLIRTRRDRGLLVILDPRLWTKRYGGLFIRSLPGGRQVRGLAEVRTFLGGGER